MSIIKDNKKKNVKLSKSSGIKNNDDLTITVTDDKMINEILGNIGKKSKNPNKMELINNFIEKKNINDEKKNINDEKKNINDEKKNKNNIQNNSNKDNNSGLKKTFTENLTKEEINEKLEDYKLVDDISTVALDTHLRYFIKKDNEMLFRMGGNLKRNLDLPKFIVLKNALGTEWSVQVKDTVFYKKMSIKEIKEEYDDIISDLHDKIKKLKAKIKELEK
jgi:hypothetical protein